jgi:hypothetical protein
MRTSETTGALAAALAKAHLKIDNPELDGVNPHFKHKFSTLAAVLNAVRKPLAEQGIAMMQSVAIEEGRVAVTTSLIHASGEWLQETMAFPVANNANIQQAGSLVTYIRRYSIIALCGIVGDPHADDDGEGDRIDRDEPRKPFRPENARGAAPAPKESPKAPAKQERKAEPPPPPADRFPDTGEHDVLVERVIDRPGKPVAILVRSEELGSAFVTSPPEFMDFIRDTVGQTMTMGLDRIGNALTVTHIRAAAPTINLAKGNANPDEEPEIAASPDEDELPF